MIINYLDLLMSRFITSTSFTPFFIVLFCSLIWNIFFCLFILQIFLCVFVSKHYVGQLHLLISEKWPYLKDVLWGPAEHSLLATRVIYSRNAPMWDVWAFLLLWGWLSWACWWTVLDLNLVGYEPLVFAISLAPVECDVGFQCGLSHGLRRNGIGVGLLGVGSKSLCNCVHGLVSWSWCQPAGGQARS